MNKSITFSFPLERPHCGVPMANGNFGALVWGKDTLNLTVNQNDLWDHRGGELIDERDTYSRLVEYAEAHRFDHSLNETLHARRRSQDVRAACRSDVSISTLRTASVR